MGDIIGDLMVVGFIGLKLGFLELGKILKMVKFLTEYI
jgi:hypothetical protein